jgi:hypothetical protein
VLHVLFILSVSLFCVSLVMYISFPLFFAACLFLALYSSFFISLLSEFPAPLSVLLFPITLSLLLALFLFDISRFLLLSNVNKISQLIRAASV